MCAVDGADRDHGKVVGFEFPRFIAENYGHCTSNDNPKLITVLVTLEALALTWKDLLKLYQKTIPGKEILITAPGTCFGWIRQRYRFPLSTLSNGADSVHNGFKIHAWVSGH